VQSGYFQTTVQDNIKKEKVFGRRPEDGQERSGKLCFPVADGFGRVFGHKAPIFLVIFMGVRPSRLRLPEGSRKLRRETDG